MTTANKTRALAPADAPLILMERRLDAPPADVWPAWTTPGIAQWWGPDGYTITILAMDVRPGGLFRFTMYAPDGAVFPSRIQYREVRAPYQLAYLHGSDIDDDPEAFEVMVTFIPDAGGTIARMQSTLTTMAAREAVKAFGAVELGIQTMEKMAAFVTRS